MQRNNNVYYFTFTSRDGILLCWMSVLAVIQTKQRLDKFQNINIKKSI